MAINTSIAVGTTNTVILLANSWREALVLQNQGTSDAFIAFGEPAVLNKGHLLEVGSTLTLSDDLDIELMHEWINGIVASWTTTLLLIYK